MIIQTNIVHNRKWNGLMKEKKLAFFISTEDDHCVDVPRHGLVSSTKQYRMCNYIEATPNHNCICQYIII